MTNFGCSTKKKIKPQQSVHDLKVTAKQKFRLINTKQNKEKKIHSIIIPIGLCFSNKKTRFLSHKHQNKAY